MTSTSHHPAVLIAHEKGLIRANELAKFGASGAVLQQLLATGQLNRVTRGLYAPASKSLSEMDDLGVVAIKYPQLVFCLLTALQIHELTTQLPHQLWVAIGQKARAPKLDFPPLRIIRMNDLSFGLTTLIVDGGIPIQVTNVAKTIADCFKYRNKIGIDVALEALRDAWRQKKVTMDEIWQAAEHCRVQNVIRPYMESLV
jgi:predicted transcriptional regulator of viral defense system